VAGGGAGTEPRRAAAREGLWTRSRRPGREPDAWRGVAAAAWRRGLTGDLAGDGRAMAAVTYRVTARAEMAARPVAFARVGVRARDLVLLVPGAAVAWRDDDWYSISCRPFF
jgi:hypothetical protein